MKISIALTTYNGERFLQAQLESFASQSMLPDELVVCDDGSTDKSIEIVDRFAKKAPFEVAIHRNSSNLGFTKNFAKALSLCTGDLVFTSDQDDVWFEEKIATVVRAFQTCPGMMLVVHDAELVDENLVSRGATKLGQTLAGYGSSDHLIAGALTAARREFVDLALPIPDGIVGHDVWMHLLARHLQVRLVVDLPLQLMRRHSSNTSNWVVSSVERIGRFDVLRSQLLTRPADDYSNRFVLNHALRDRVLSCRHVLAIPGASIENGLAGLALEEKAIRCRDALPKAGPIKRRVLALRMLNSGQYRYFSGLGSFVRDFSR